jgi:hypothetical protein
MAASRVAQGLPPKVEDPAVLAYVASIIRPYVEQLEAERRERAGEAS